MSRCTHGEDYALWSLRTSFLTTTAFTPKRSQIGNWNPNIHANRNVLHEMRALDINVHKSLHSVDRVMVPEIAVRVNRPADEIAQDERLSWVEGHEELEGVY
jgi:hypothetical protein